MVLEPDKLFKSSFLLVFNICVRIVMVFVGPRKFFY